MAKKNIHYDSFDSLIGQWDTVNSSFNAENFMKSTHLKLIVRDKAEMGK